MRHSVALSCSTRVLRRQYTPGCAAALPGLMFLTQVMALTRWLSGSVVTAYLASVFELLAGRLAASRFVIYSLIALLGTMVRSSVLAPVLGSTGGAPISPGAGVSLTALLAAPLLLVTLITGVLVGVLQAATQINEMTLSFIPKLLALVLTLLITGPWMLQLIIGYTRTLFTNIPGMLG